MNKTLTLIFTVRIDSKERLQNLRSTLAYYHQVTNGSHMIVLEADTEPKLDTIMAEEFPEADYIFVKDGNRVFHRTRYINAELRRVSTPNAAVIDADVVVPAPQLELANRILLTDPQCAMVIPYDGRAIDHTPWRSDLFRKTRDAESLTMCDGFQHLMFGHMSVGGAYLANVERYHRLGWENENFNGWGCEDHERFHRLDILGHKPRVISGKIHHLNHPRGINSGNVIESVVLATKREYCRVCAMNPEQLRAYVDSWTW